jgi:shikimate kinase
MRAADTKTVAPQSVIHSVALVGFMGVGKSRVGRLAARLLRVPFVDCDSLIEDQHGPIPDIFATRGEQLFRELERDEVLKALSAATRRPAVVSLGGGAVLSADVREALQRLPHVVWITAPCDVLWERVRSATAKSRPLARDELGFRRLFDEREALYACVATDQVTSDCDIAPQEIAREVARIADLPSSRRRQA